MSKSVGLIGSFMACRQALARHISHIVPPRDIEDIVQETYVRACLVEQKEKIKYPRSYLLKTVKNLALDHVKKAEARLTSTVDGEGLDIIVQDAADIDETFSKASIDEEFKLFCEAVRYLPVQCRKAFVLKKVYSFSQREIAEYINISQSTVEKHIAHGVKTCTIFMMRALEGDSQDKSPVLSNPKWSDQ